MPGAASSSIRQKGLPVDRVFEGGSHQVCHDHDIHPSARQDQLRGMYPGRITCLVNLKKPHPQDLVRVSDPSELAEEKHPMLPGEPDTRVGNPV